MDSTKDIPEDGGETGGDITEENGGDIIDFAHFCCSFVLCGTSVLGV